MIAPGNPASPLASMRPDHFAVRVSDFDKALAWYVDTLDFRLIRQWPHGDLRAAYLVAANDESFRIEILGTHEGDFGSRHEPAVTGWHHLCFEVDDIDATVAELRRRDVAIMVEPYESQVIARKVAFFADPWANLFQLTQMLEA